jgi:hypothetical protein
LRKLELEILSVRQHILGYEEPDATRLHRHWLDLLLDQWASLHSKLVTQDTGAAQPYVPEPQRHRDSVKAAQA